MQPPHLSHRVLTVTGLLALLPCAACSGSEGSPAGPSGPRFDQVLFETRVDLGTGVDRTADVALADLDGDGRLDLAAADLEGAVQVSLGQDDGRFRPAANHPVAGTPLGIRAADLDLDGDIDLCTIGANAGALSVLRNDGSGTLTVEAPIPIQPLPTDFVVGDYDADGLVDLVVAHLSRADILLLRGRADGSFDAPQSLELPRGTRAAGLALGDVTLDGFVDLVICDTDNERVVVEIGSAGGLGGSRAVVPVGVRPVAVSLGDLDGDTVPDIAVSNFDSQSVQLLEWNGGSAQFTTTATRTLDGNPARSVVGDVTGDGIDDLAVCVLNQSVVRVWAGTGGGLAEQALEWAATGFPFRPLLEDLNLDGHLDLILVPADYDRVSVLFGTGDGLLGAQGYDFGVTAAEAVVAADLDGDGVEEVFVTGSATDELVVGRAIDDGGRLDFAEDARIDVGTRAQRIRIGTLFTQPDLLLTTREGPVVFRNRSSGGKLELERLPGAGGTLGRTVLMGDVRAAALGGGPLNDLVYTDFGADRVFVLFDGLQNFRFASPVATPVEGGPLGVAAVDLDVDGSIEVAVARNRRAAVSIFRVSEAGALEPFTELVTGSDPTNLETGDFDGDLRPDLVVANSGSASVTVYLHRGGTRFEVVTLETGAAPTALTVADFDLDGDDDFAVGALTGAEFRIFLDEEGGYPGRTLVFPGTWGTTSSAYTDLDGDERPELLFGTVIGTRFHVARNRSRRVGN